MVEHVIMYCEKYKDDREKLLEEVQRKEDIEINVRYLLNPEQISNNRAALIKYLENTGLMNRIWMKYVCMHAWATLGGGGWLPPLISSVMESLMSAKAWLYGVLDGAKYPQTKANTIKRSGKLSNVFCSVEQCIQSKTYLLISSMQWPIRNIVIFHNSLTAESAWVLHARLVNHLMMTN